MERTTVLVATADKRIGARSARILHRAPPGKPREESHTHPTILGQESLNCKGAAQIFILPDESTPHRLGIGYRASSAAVASKNSRNGRLPAGCCPQWYSYSA